MSKYGRSNSRYSWVRTAPYSVPSRPAVPPTTSPSSIRARALSLSLLSSTSSSVSSLISRDSAGNSKLSTSVSLISTLTTMSSSNSPASIPTSRKVIAASTTTPKAATSVSSTSTTSLTASVPTTKALGLTLPTSTPKVSAATSLTSISKAPATTSATSTSKASASTSLTSTTTPKASTSAAAMVLKSSRAGLPYSSPTLDDLIVTAADDKVAIVTDVCKKLGESKKYIIEFAIEEFGKQAVIDLYKNTVTKERQGGVLVMDGTRRRTPGGVFLVLVRGSRTLQPTDVDRFFIHLEQHEMELEQNRVPWRGGYRGIGRARGGRGVRGIRRGQRGIGRGRARGRGRATRPYHGRGFYSRGYYRGGYQDHYNGSYYGYA